MEAQEIEARFALKGGEGMADARLLPLKLWESPVLQKTRQSYIAMLQRMEFAPGKSELNGLFPVP